MSDNITLPREVVQDALDALTGADDFSPGGTPIYMQEITALRTALAAEQPKVSVTLNPDAMRTVSSGDAVLAASSVAVTVSSALAAEQPKPVRLHATTTGVLLGSAWLVWNTPVGANDEIMSQETADLLNRIFADAEALRRDAERYRWLRDKAPPDIGDMASVRDLYDPSEIDAAIDAAMENKR